MKIIKYKYQEGDIITDIKSGKLKILEQIRIKSGKNNEKAYRYECLICGNKDVIRERRLNNHNGCNVCCTPTKKILKGYNDMWTTNPELASLLADPNDGYKYTQSSGQRVDWICSNCGNIIKNKLINNINQHGLFCPKCSDKLPYPEKFVFNVLQQLLKDDFIYQLSKTNFKWCKDYRYDFYFKVNNESYIAETNGLQHYQKQGRKDARTVEEEQQNDRLKKQLALQNGIKPENYIVIDCKESTLKWIKDHILSSRLNDIFDLSKIDWLQCHEFACSSLVKKVCSYWINGIHNITKIIEITKLSRATVRTYLKQGSEIWNKCNYDPKKEYEKSLSNIQKINKKQVVCLNNKKVFKSIREAAKYFNMKSACGISFCCKNKQVHSGVDSSTEECLQWQYYDDYLIKPKKLLSNTEISKTRKRKIICLNNNKIFNSIKEAEKYYSVNNIYLCCEHKKEYVGKDSKTREKLKWMYYDEYLELKNKLRR